MKLDTHADRTVGDYVIRKATGGPWVLHIASTMQAVRTYYDYDRAVSDAERYTRMTAASA